MKSTVTSKGQITLPKTIRQHLHLHTGDKVEFLVQADGTVQVIPVTASLTRLRGMLPKPDRPLTLADMEQAIYKGAGDFDRD